MIAADTTLLARLLLQDDVQQHKKVKAPFKTKQTFTAPVTVMLELVWVLESNGCDAPQIVSGLRALLGLPNFKPERADAIREALQRYADGLGFADALHLALSKSEEKFMTFDKAFQRPATKQRLKPVVALA